QDFAVGHSRSSERHLVETWYGDRSLINQLVEDCIPAGSRLLAIPALTLRAAGEAFVRSIVGVPAVPSAEVRSARTVDSSDALPALEFGNRYLDPRHWHIAGTFAGYLD